MTFFKNLKSLIIFGQLLSLIRLRASFNKLNMITAQTDFNEFQAKKTYNELQRNEEIFLYGKTLTFDQREKQNHLLQWLPDNDVHKLLIGRYVRKNGQIINYFAVELFLLSFGLVVLGTSVAILLKIVAEVAFLPIAAAPKISFFITLAIVFGIPLFQLYNRHITPSYICILRSEMLKNL